MANPPRTCQDYQIGIICALATEKAAMVAMLDGESHSRLKKEDGDDNDYTLGQIGAHNVVIACLPAGLIGHGPAAIIANNMRRSFPIRFGLMVGVGGGVPSKKDDIRLGDVVVSQPTGTHGGVVQWDFGKTGKGGIFQRTGSLDKPPLVLLHALQSMKEREITDGIDLEASLSLMVQNKPRMSETYRYQGADHDQLFEATYDHKGDEACDECDPKSIVRRDPRSDSTPKIHYGNIASGNKVIKHGITRDKIAEKEGVICFEMEAAGLMDSFRCLVIRGICDYADSHKNKIWQPYAAATAAAYAKELLSIIPPQEIVPTKKAAEVLPKSTEVECIRTLYTSDYDSRRKQYENRVMSTCKWIESNDMFLNWQKDNQSRILWITGEPGRGKSFLACHLVEFMESQATTKDSVCHFFFDGTHDSGAVALCAILHQIYILNEVLLEHAVKRYKSRGRIFVQEFGTLENIFQETVRDPRCGPIICIIDGLDQCEQMTRDMLLNWVVKLFSDTPNCSSKSLKMIVTSRGLPAIERILGTLPGIAIDMDGMTPLHRAATAGHESIVQLLLGREANIESEDFRGRTALHCAATEGHETVMRVLLSRRARIEAKDNSGKTALHYAAKNGLVAIVQLLLEKGANINIKDRLGNVALDYALETKHKAVAWLLSYGPKMESIDSNGDTMLHWAAANGQEVAVRLLLEKGAYIAAKTVNGRTALLRAAQNGHEQVVRLLLEKGADIKAGDSNRQTALHLAVSNRHEAVVRVLLSKSAKIDAKDNSGKTALHYAVENGLVTMAQLLLEEGANVNMKDGLGNMALDYAIKTKHEAMAWLLNYGPKIEAIDSNGDTMLYWAAANGQEAAVRLLLEKGAYVVATTANNGTVPAQRVAANRQDAAYIAAKTANIGTALLRAAQNGHEQVVRLLLEKGADIKAEDSNRQTALHLAASNGHLAMVRLLLEKGADIEAEAINGATALHMVAEKGEEQVVLLLLENGADVVAKNKIGWTALHIAAWKRDEALVRLLVEKGADVKAGAENGVTALHLAASNGQSAMVRLLVEKGASITAESINGTTALHSAASNGHLAVVRLLIEKGASIAAKSINGTTALHFAAQNDHEQVVRLLVEKGADVKARLKSGVTALHLAASKGHSAMVRLLVEKGADIKAKNKNGGTALDVAAAQKQEVVVRLLKGYGHGYLSKFRPR